MKTFIIQDYINSYSNLSLAGKALYNDLLPIIETEPKITLDFKDTGGVASLFLNTSFGDLMDIFGIEKIKKAFKYVNIQNTQIERIRKYFEDYAFIKSQPTLQSPS